MDQIIRSKTGTMARGAAWLLALALGIGGMPADAASGYTARGGKLYDPAGKELQVRGISHFGFSSGILQPQYLWSMGWKEQIAQIKQLGFNAVRLPFVPDALYVTTPVDELSWVDPQKNPELLGKTPLQVLDLWMAEANRQGLYVMLNFHSVSRVKLYPTWFVDTPADYALTYNGQPYSADDWVRDVRFVATRYAHLPNFFAIDLYNEPNGRVRWSQGDPNVTDAKYYWKPAAERAAAAVLAANPRLLIFVQGINGNYDGIEDSTLSMNWGESLQQQAYQPLEIPADKLVLSPHTYGPDVYRKASFSAPDYPHNLAADWETLFGRFAGTHPVVIGEWGGRYGQGGTGAADVAWQNALVDYLIAKDLRSSFYWSYTPNSSDTGGILDDALAVRADKMALLQRLWGAPPAVTPPVVPAPAPAPAPAPVAAILEFDFATVSVTQTATSVTLRVRRSGGSTGAVNLRYASLNGSARSGRDYSAVEGSLRWAKHDTADKLITVPLLKQKAFAGTRSFGVRLSKPSTGAVLGSASTATVGIRGTR